MVNDVVTIKPKGEESKTVSIRDEKAARFFWSDYLTHSFDARTNLRDKYYRKKNKR
jgi:hypothetical protein